MKKDPSSSHLGKTHVLYEINVVSDKNVMWDSREGRGNFQISQIQFIEPKK